MNALRFGDMELTVETVSPEVASRWLEQNGTNRPIRSRVVAQYSRDFANGYWAEKPLPICFDRSGNLVNGQHTLTAFLRSGISSFRFLICRNCPPPAIGAMDRGVGRTVTDVAHFLEHRIENSRQASVARYLRFGVRDGEHRSYDEYWDAYQQHEDAIQFTLQIDEQIKSTSVRLPPAVLSVIAAAWYTQDRDRLLEFVRVLKEGTSDQGEADSGAVKLRDYLLMPKKRGEVRSRIQVYERAQGALRAFLERQRLIQLKAVAGDIFKPRTGDSTSNGEVTEDDHEAA